MIVNDTEKASFSSEPYTNVASSTFEDHAYLETTGNKVFDMKCYVCCGSCVIYFAAQYLALLS